MQDYSDAPSPRERYAPLVAQIIDTAEIKHLLDYGCGSPPELAKHLRGKVRHAFSYQAFDARVPAFESPPIPAQMVVAIDVLRADEADALLDHLYELVQEVGFFSVDSDQPKEWWLPRICARFDLQTFQQVGDEFYVIVYAIPRAIEGTDGGKLGYHAED